MRYEMTHVSYHDGSPAMLVREREGSVRMMNEDGYVWSDPAWWWIPLAEVTDEDRERWADNEGEWPYETDDAVFDREVQEYYDPMGYNSDSYIAYLNRH